MKLRIEASSSLVFLPLPLWDTPRDTWWSLPHDKPIDSWRRHRPEWNRWPEWDSMPIATESLILLMLLPKLLSNVVWELWWWRFSPRWRRLGHWCHIHKPRWEHFEEFWWCVVKQSRRWNFGFDLRLCFCYRRRWFGLRLRWWSPEPRICMWSARLWFLTWFRTRPLSRLRCGCRCLPWLSISSNWWWNLGFVSTTGVRRPPSWTGIKVETVNIATHRVVRFPSCPHVWRCVWR